MRNYAELMKECMKELDSIGIQYSPDILGIRVNNRLKVTLGLCRRTGRRYYTIEIAGRVVKDCVNPNFIKGVIMHELVHTMPGAYNHGPTFHRYASIINKKLGYNIKTTENEAVTENAGVETKYKYALVCNKCGKYIKKTRWSIVLANPKEYMHGGCGGDFHTISLDPKITIASAH